MPRIPAVLLSASIALICLWPCSTVTAQKVAARLDRNLPEVSVAIAAGQDTTPARVFSPLLLQRADSIAAAEYAKDSLGSITVGIVSGSKLVWEKSYGFSDSARKVLATPANVYLIASVSKQFTAFMLLQLIEQHRVSLSDPVEKFFPEINRVRGRAPGAAPVTLLQLATMTSGLPRNGATVANNPASAHGAVRDWVHLLTDALPSMAYATEPGAVYRYSNVGYSILAAALARAANEEYTSYIARHVLVPLGMSSSGFELTPALAARLATGVDFDVLVKGNLNWADAAELNRRGLGAGVAAGGLYSTVGDLAKFVSAELGYMPAGVLRPETLKIVSQVPIAANATMDYGYGLGFQAYRWGDTVAFGKSGNLSGYTSMVLYDTKLKFGVIVLRSAGGGETDPETLAGRVFRRLLRDYVPVPPSK